MDPGSQGGAREGAAQWPGPSGAQQDAQPSTAADFADQILAAQLQALQLGGGGGAPVGAYPALQGHAASHSPGTSSHGSSPQLDPSLVSSDLLARLQAGAAGGSIAVPGLAGSHLAPTSAGLPAAAVAAAAAAAAAASQQPGNLAQQLAQQQQQQQQRNAPAPGRRRAGGSGGGGRRNEEKVRRTVYISDISDSVSEEQLAAYFQEACGPLVDCRVCGDPNSSMRFAFIEFVTDEGAQLALARSGSVLGDFPIRVSPSKTAIVPVNNTYLPRSTEERQLVARTVFVANIDRVVEREQLREFFENLCGPVSKIRVLGDVQHNSKIAFVEFATAESARGALKLSGALLGTLPLRVSPSKTPVRIDSRRSQDPPGRSSMAAALPAPLLGGAGAPLSMPLAGAGLPSAAGGMLPAGLPGVGIGMPGVALPPGALPPGAMTLANQQLTPALLMAVAGLQGGMQGYPQGGWPAYPPGPDG